MLAPNGTSTVAGSKLRQYPMGSEFSSSLSSCSPSSPASAGTPKLLCKAAIRVVFPLPAIPTTSTHTGEISRNFTD